MGRPKLLLSWHGKTIIERLLEAWREGGLSHVLVVVRPDDAELAALVRQSGAEVVIADPPPADMRASVRIGLAYLAEHYQPKSDDVWLMAPADLPSLSADVIRQLLAAHLTAEPRVLVACHHGRRGHPVLFPWRYAAELDQLGAAEGINRLVERARPALIECGAGALCADIDTPADYNRWQGKD